MIQVIFIGVTLLSCVLFYLGTGKDQNILFFFLLWITATGTLSYFSFFENSNAVPPRLLFVLMPSIIYVIYFYRKLNAGMFNVNYLLAIHIVRIPVELTLYELFLLGKVPVIMTYKGWNFDIIVGISAIILLLWSVLINKLNKRFFIIWNILGIIFLTIIVVTAILSAPSPLQKLAFKNPNVAILQFPYTLLPAVIVPIVLLSHLLAIKKMAGLTTGRRSMLNENFVSGI